MKTSPLYFIVNCSALNEFWRWPVEAQDLCGNQISGAPVTASTQYFNTAQEPEAREQ